MGFKGVGMLNSKIKILVYTLCVTVSLLYEPCAIPAESLYELAKTAHPIGIFFAEMRESVAYHGIQDTFLVIAVWFLLNNCYGKRRIYPFQSHILAALFSFFMVLGKSIYFSEGVFTGCLSSPAKLFMMMVSLTGYCILFVPLIDVCRHRFVNISESGEWKENVCLQFIFEKHPVLSSFIILSIFELPYWIFFYPGTAMGDGVAQLTMYYGMNTLLNHHPVLSTMLMGMVMDIGKMLGDPNLGLFCYTFLQSVIQIFAFTSVFIFAKKYNLPYVFRIVTLAYFSIFSVWKVSGITLVKDSAFYIAFLLFFMSVLDYWLLDQDSWKLYLKLFLTGFAVWAFRNNGYYLVLISLFVLLFKNTKKIRIFKMLGLAVLFLMVNTGYHRVFLPYVGAEEGSVREMLSVPTQQTARCCKYYSDEFTIEEKNVLESVFSCSVQELGERYHSEYADPVKNSFLLEPSINDLIQYFKVWAKQCIRHPVVYMDAFFNQCYGYFYPDREVFDVVSYYEIEGESFFPEEMKVLRLHQNDFFREVRYVVINFENMLSKLPLLNYFYRCGTYTWIFLFLIMVLAASKLYKDCLVGIVLLAVLGMNCISPVNAYMRYQLPLMAAMPVFLMFVSYQCRIGGRKKG